MKFTQRVFLIDARDRVRPLTFARFQRLWDGKEKEGDRLPEHAGKRVRIAIAYVGLEGRKLTEIVRLELMLLRLDREGRVDAKERGRKLREAMEAAFIDFDQPARIAEAEAQFARMRYRRRCSWEITPEISAALAAEIFKGPRLIGP